MWLTGVSVDILFRWTAGICLSNPQSLHHLDTTNIFSKSPLSSFPIISTCSQESPPRIYLTFYHGKFPCVTMKYFKFNTFDWLTSLHIIMCFAIEHLKFYNFATFRQQRPPPHLCGWQQTRPQLQAPRSGRAGWGPAPSCEPGGRCYHFSNLPKL